MLDHPSYLTPSEVLTKILKNEIEMILHQEEYTQEPIFPKVTKQLACCMVVGLQGAGKTTTLAKIAHRMFSTLTHKPVLTSFDFSRFAAQEQLSKLASKIPAPFFPTDPELSLKQNAENALAFAKDEKATLLLVDTPGTSQIQDKAMDLINTLGNILRPTETLLVLDSMTGQDSIKIGTEFHNKISLTGVILSKSDGDTRGGAALSIRYVTKLPVKYMGNGEKPEDLQIFHFKRVVSQILKQGDLETLKETLGSQMNKSKAPVSDKIDMNTIKDQLEQINSMGGMQKLLKLMPEHAIDKTKIPNENLLTQSKSAIDSMTPKERANPKIINGSRKRRIAAGSGTSIAQINKLLKQYKQMKIISKRSSKTGQNPIR